MPAKTSTPVADLPWLPPLRRELRDALAPWIEAFSTGARFECDGSRSDARLCVHIRTDRPMDVRVFEAIELLALLGGVDDLLYFYFVHGTENDQFYQRELPRRVIPIECTLDIPRDDDIASWCERFVVGGIEATASEEYLRIRALLESAYTMVDEAPPQKVSRIKRDALVVAVEVQTLRRDFVECDAQLAQVAMTQHTRDTISMGVFRPYHWKPIFRVTTIDAEPRRQLSTKSFLYFTQIVRCGITVTFLDEFDIEVEAASAAVFAHGLQLLTGTPSRDHDQSKPASPMKELKLPVYMTERTIAAIFSALMTSTSVEFLSINHMNWHEEADNVRVMSRQERSHLWKWIAIAVFSRYAAHRVERVALSVYDFNEEDVAAFRFALEQSESAIKSSPPSDPEGVKPLEKVCVSRVLLSPPLLSLTMEYGSPVSFASQDMWVEGEEDGHEDSNWLRVILPGCGRAWVHRTWTTPSVTTHVADPARVPEMIIAGMNDRSKTPVLELLRLVGAHLQSLRILHSESTDPLDGFVRGMLEACPRLESLSIDSSLHLTSMDVFVDMYQQRACHVRSLRLDDVRLTNAPSLTEFVRLLGDDTLHMSTCLREITVNARHVEAPLENFASVLDATLSSNTVLQDLEMSVSYQPGIPVLDRKAVTGLQRRHRGKPVAVRWRPLGLIQKLAFLSVLAAIERRDGDVTAATSDCKRRRLTPAQHLDHRVLTHIFEYAAKTKKRELSVWMTTEREVEVEPEAEGDVEGHEEDDAMAGERRG